MLYLCLGTKEGENYIYVLTKITERKTIDLNQLKCVKDDEGNVLVKEIYIKDRWKKYFHNLFNEGYDILLTLTW